MLRTPVHAHFSKSNARHTNIHIRMTISVDMVISKKQQKKKKTIKRFSMDAIDGTTT